MVRLSIERPRGKCSPRDIPRQATIDHIVELFAAWAERTKALGAIAIDPSSALDRVDSPYFPDGHLTAQGHQVVAMSIAKAMDHELGG